MVVTIERPQGLNSVDSPATTEETTATATTGVLSSGC
jgi:hypothetical protein